MGLQCIHEPLLDVASGESVSTPPLMINGRPHLPFQLQTEYTTADGSVLVRVITKVKPVTEDRQVAERGETLVSELRYSIPFCMFL